LLVHYFLYLSLYYPLCLLVADTRSGAINKAIKDHGVKRSEITSCRISVYYKAYVAYCDAISCSNSIRDAALIANKAGWNCTVDCQDQWYEAINDTLNAEGESYK